MISSSFLVLYYYRTSYIYIFTSSSSFSPLLSFLLRFITAENGLKLTLYLCQSIETVNTYKVITNLAAITLYKNQDSWFSVQFRIKGGFVLTETTAWFTRWKLENLLVNDNWNKAEQTNSLEAAWSRWRWASMCLGSGQIKRLLHCKHSYLWIVGIRFIPFSFIFHGCIMLFIARIAFHGCRFQGSRRPLTRNIQCDRTWFGLQMSSCTCAYVCVCNPQDLAFLPGRSPKNPARSNCSQLERKSER